MKAFIVCAIVLIIADYVSSAITYQLYSKMNLKMGQPIIYKNPNSVYKSNFNSAKKNK